LGTPFWPKPNGIPDPHFSNARKLGSASEKIRNHECEFIAETSPVAAGGIVSVSPIGQAVTLTADDRLCDSLTLSIQGSFPIPFGIGTPDLTVSRLRGIPLHSAVWTFLPPIRRARIRVPKVQLIVYTILAIDSIVLCVIFAYVKSI